MRLQFDANQTFQTDAINSVVDLFDGQPFASTEVETGPTGGFSVVPNQLDLPAETVMRNLTHRPGGQPARALT